MPKNFNCDDPDLIKITHYVNPHMFWYKYEDSFVMNKKLTIWEDKLQKSFANKPLLPTQTFRPKIGEIVAVYNFTFNRWIRAKCDEIIVFTIANTMYVLWAIDYGIPFQSEGRYIRRMPSDVGEPSEETVFYGGINKIIPVEKEFNFETFESEIKPTSKWSPLAVRTIENLIYESAHIRFVREIIGRDGQYFGSMEFITHTNKTINAQDCLIEINHGTIVDDFFRRLRQIATNRVPRWHRNDGTSFVSKFNVNKLSNIAEFEPNKMLIRSQSIEPDFHTEEIAQKITDWTLRNNICQQDDNDDVESVCESTVSLAVIRKIATEKLPVEKVEPVNSCVPTKRGVSAWHRLEESTSNVVKSEPHGAFSDDFNSSCNEIESCISIVNPKVGIDEGVSTNKTVNQATQTTLETPPASNHDAVNHRQTTSEMPSASNHDAVNHHQTTSETPPASNHDEVDCNLGIVNGVSQSAMNIVMNRMRNKRRLVFKKLAQPEKAPDFCLPAGFDLRNFQLKENKTKGKFGDEKRQNGKFNKRPEGFKNTFANGNHNGFKQRQAQECIDEKW